MPFPKTIANPDNKYYLLQIINLKKWHNYCDSFYAGEVVGIIGLIFLEHPISSSPMLC